MIDQTVSLLLCSTLCWAIPQANLIARWKWGWSSPHSGKNPLKTSNLRIFTYQPLSGFLSHQRVRSTSPIKTPSQAESDPPEEKEARVPPKAESDPLEEKEARVPPTCPIRLPTTSCQPPIETNFLWTIPRVNLIARWKWGWSTPYSGKSTEN